MVRFPHMMGKAGLFVSLCVFSATALAGGDKAALWHEWYTFTRGGAPAGYYEELVERKPGTNEVSFTQRIVEAGALGGGNTFVHSVANDDDRTSPVSFYVKKRSRTTIDIFEGIMSGTEMGVRIHVGADNSVPDTNLWKITPSSILGAFVPYYLAKQWKRGGFKKAKEIKFEALLEEGDENRKFTPAKVKASASETIVKVLKENCREYKLRFNDIPAIWWVTDAGKLCKMTIPSLEVNLTLETRERAKAFL